MILSGSQLFPIGGFMATGDYNLRVRRSHSVEIIKVRVNPAVFGSDSYDLYEKGSVSGSTHIGNVKDPNGVHRFIRNHYEDVVEISETAWYLRCLKFGLNKPFSPFYSGGLNWGISTNRKTHFLDFFFSFLNKKMNLTHRIHF